MLQGRGDVHARLSRILKSDFLCEQNGATSARSSLKSGRPFPLERAAAARRNNRSPREPPIPFNARRDSTTIAERRHLMSSSVDHVEPSSASFKTPPVGAKLSFLAALIDLRLGTKRTGEKGAQRRKGKYTRAVSTTKRVRS